MSTSSPDDIPPPPELQGLDPKDLLQAGLETVPTVTLPPQPVDSDATIPVAPPQSTQPAAQVELPLPEELTKLLPGGNYHVESFLGQGGMGAVYKGMQVRLKRPVAIKIMRRDMGKDYDFEARFEREAQAMAKLNHPNIVSVIDFGEAGPDYLYIVMELIDGADLMDVIRGGQMTQEMALSLLPQICDALQFAHDHGIVHRDIKPSNIMLTRDGRVKMCDFGLAKRYDVESSFRTQTGTGMGTPDYAAPEQFDPNGHIDHRADIYALGVMIYQMITGQLPRGVWKPPSQRAEIAPQWDDIVSRAMQSDPSDRYQHASDIKTDVSSIPLRTVKSDAGTPARKESAAADKPRSREANARSASKPRTPLFLGIIGTAIVIVVAALLFKNQRESNAVASTPNDKQNEMTPRTSVATIGGLPTITGWRDVTNVARESMIRVAKTGSREEGDWIVAQGKGKSSFPMFDWVISDIAIRGKVRGQVKFHPRTNSRLPGGSYGILCPKNGKGRITKVLNQSYTSTEEVTLLEFQVPPAEERDFLITFMGPEIRVWLDGKLAVSVRDESFKSGIPMMAVLEAGAAFKNLELAELTASPSISKSKNEPQEWEDILEHYRKIEGWFAPHWIHQLGRVEWVQYASKEMTNLRSKDQALRVTWASATGRRFPTLRLRTAGTKSESDAHYAFGFSTTHMLVRFHPNGPDQMIDLAQWPLPDGFEITRPHTYEVRVIGNELSASVDDQPLGSVKYDELKEGFPAISADIGTIMTELKYASLDKAQSGIKPGAAKSTSNSQDAINHTASSTPFPPGQWVKLFTKPEDLPADMRKPDSGVKWEDGWIKLGQQKRKVSLPAELTSNYAVRGRFMRHGMGENNRIMLRQEGSNPEYYLLGFEGAKLSLRYYKDTVFIPLADVKTPSLGAGSEYLLQFGVVNKRLIGRYADSVLAFADGSHLRQGRASVFGSEDLRDIEVMNLDGLPEAEALRLLGVDEKGNDLRGKAGAAATSATPTPVWRDALTEAPLKGVIAKADYTDKGYLLPPGNHWEFPAQPVRAGVIRVLAVTEAGSPNHLSLNFGLPGTRDHYQVFFRRKLNECGLSYLKEGQPERRLAVKQGVNLTDGEPHELLLARIADQFYFLLNGEVILQATEPDATARYLTLNCFGDTRARVQKIEYLNLDGVNEAEALRLLGVDEKGNDVRGKTGAQK